jgi:catechol 2,3-dioxygenase-like lactoylglutathione lyase family enzyme
MTSAPTPRIECERHHPILSVSDVPAAIDFYTKKLGFTLAFADGDPPTFAGINLGETQIFLRQGAPSSNGVAVYFVVGDANELAEFHRAGGVNITEPIADRPYGLRDYNVQDLDGHILTFGDVLLSCGPPVPITRVDVPVRLEKRLAALLADLAAYKRMGVDNCLEEILLHTCEPYGTGVASPHTPNQLRHIQQLKQKHGIDYDTHASYRFVEEP